MDKTILAVESSGLNRIRIAKALEREYRVIEAEGGRDALEQMDTLKRVGDHVDIILARLDMPDMDGVELTRRVKADRRYDQTTVAISAPEREASRVREAGADLHMAAPIDVDGLLDALEHVMSEKAAKAFPGSSALTGTGI